jgi:hypothetical protein
MDDFINQLTSIATTWQSAGAIAGLILVVNLLTNLTKLQIFASKVPAAARSYIAAGLGTVGGLLAALAKGLPVPQALLSGLVIGLSAIGTHEVVTNAKTSVRLRRAMRAVKPVAIICLLIGGMTIMSQVACGAKGTGTNIPQDADAAYDCAKEQAEAAGKNINVFQAVLDVLGVIEAAVTNPSSLLTTLDGLAQTYTPAIVACVVDTIANEGSGSGGGSATVAKLSARVVAAQGVIKAKGWKFSSSWKR